MLAFGTAAIGIRIREIVNAVVTIDPACFASRVTGQTRVTNGIHVSGTYPLPRLKAGANGRIVTGFDISVEGHRRHTFRAERRRQFWRTRRGSPALDFLAR